MRNQFDCGTIGTKESAVYSGRKIRAGVFVFGEDYLDPTGILALGEGRKNINLPRSLCKIKGSEQCSRSLSSVGATLGWMQTKITKTY